MVSGNLVGRKGLPCIAFHPHNKTWQIVCISILDKDSERMGKYILSGVFCYASLSLLGYKGGGEGGGQ